MDLSSAINLKTVWSTWKDDFSMSNTNDAETLKYLDKFLTLTKKFHPETSFFFDYEVKPYGTELFFGGMCLQQEIPLPSITDEDFMTLAVMPFDCFNHFVSVSEIRHMFETINQHKVVTIFSILDNLLVKNFKISTTRKFDSATDLYTEISNWSLKHRVQNRKLFLETSRLVEAKPDVPIELLMELLCY